MAGIDVKIDLSADNINKAVTQAIIDSSIGTQLKDAIDYRIKEWAREYNSPIGAIVQKEMDLIVLQILRDEYREKIKEIARPVIAALLEEKVVVKLIGEVFDRFINDGS